MAASEKTVRQIKRAISRIAARFPASEEAEPMTDIFLRVNRETGEMLALDGDGRELDRCTVEEWAGGSGGAFLAGVQPVLRQCLHDMRPVLLGMGVMKPFSFSLSDECGGEPRRLCVVDDEAPFAGGGLMKDFDRKMDAFLERLMKS